MRSLFASFAPLTLGSVLLACTAPRPSQPSQQSPSNSTESGSGSAVDPSASASPEPLSGRSGSAVQEPVTLGPLLGVAKAVCPEGPYEVPLRGVREAEEIPRTSPVTLDAQDKSFHLFEGPVWWRSALYFSDFETTPGFPSRILRYTPGLSLAVEVEDAGTNGLALEPGLEGLLGASHKTKSVVRFSEDLKAVEPLAQSFAGKPFNSPNDLTMRSDGHVYFTDPDFQAGDSETQGSTNVYWVTPKGVVSAVETTIKNPNGIAISPDERFLLVSGNLEAGFVKRYPLAEDGSVGRGTIIVESVSVPDGMTFDCAGHLYVTEHVKRRVRVFDLSGRELGEIRGLSKNVTNVAFGGSEGKTLFITMTGGLASIELPVPGLPY